MVLFCCSPQTSCFRCPCVISVCIRHVVPFQRTKWTYIYDEGVTCICYIVRVVCVHSISTYPSFCSDPTSSSRFRPSYDLDLSICLRSPVFLIWIQLLPMFPSAYLCTFALTVGVPPRNRNWNGKSLHGNNSYFATHTQRPSWVVDYATCTTYISDSRRMPRITVDHSYGCAQEHFKDPNWSPAKGTKYIATYLKQLLSDPGKIPSVPRPTMPIMYLNQSVQTLVTCRTCRVNAVDRNLGNSNLQCHPCMFAGMVDSPIEAAIAKQFKEEKAKFIAKASEFTRL